MEVTDLCEQTVECGGVTHLCGNNRLSMVGGQSEALEPSKPVGVEFAFNPNDVGAGFRMVGTFIAHVSTVRATPQRRITQRWKRGGTFLIYVRDAVAGALRRSLGDQAELPSACHGLGTVRGSELVESVRDMLFHCVERDR